MSKQTPAELATEQEYEIRRWAREIANDALHARMYNDYATIAHLHRALAGVMRNYQRFRRKRDEAETDPS